MRLRFYIYSIVFIVILIGFKGNRAIAINAPVTYLDSVKVCPGTTVLIPLKVTGFSNISAFTLTILYDSTTVVFDTSSSSVNSIFPNALLNSVAIGPGTTQRKIILVWSNLLPVTLTDGDSLALLSFTYSSGTTDLVFDNTSNEGSDCEYANSSGITLSDVTSQLFYHNGNISSNLAGNAGTISGDDIVCQGSTGHIYSIPPITNATSYFWIVPPGASIVSGNNTNSIVVDFSTGATSGNISVYGSNSCSTGLSSSKFITVNPKPSTDGIWHN